MPLINSWQNALRSFQKKAIKEPSIKVFSSPTNRCLKVAKWLTKSPICADKKLMELNFGDWELLPWDKIPKASIENWNGNLQNYVIPSGESLGQLESRAGLFLSQIANLEESKLLVVTHGGFIRGVLKSLLNIPAENIFQIKLDFNTITTIKYEKLCWQLLSSNTPTDNFNF